MDRVHKLADQIIAREGGFVDDPDDPGGATKHGVTLKTMRDLGWDLDGSGTVTAQDVRKVTKEQARELFLDRYYRKPRIDALPVGLQPSVFDMYVNAGSNAVRVLQRLLNDMGLDVAVDGQIGPQTLLACTRANTMAPDHFCDAYGIARRNYYYALADARPQSRKYARRRDGGKGGWITRAEEFIATRYHLTDAEHSKRVAAWG